MPTPASSKKSSRSQKKGGRSRAPEKYADAAVHALYNATLLALGLGAGWLASGSAIPP